MKISYNTLNKIYFAGTLPVPETIADALTFHAWEIEEITKVGEDTVLDVKVLPDKSAWALSHRGIAKDLSVILNLPLAKDPLSVRAELTPVTPEIAVTIDSEVCDRYTVALIRGVKIGPSPAWLSKFLVAIGQRSINNVVDITNYVMFMTGQPLHAFDAGKMGAVSGVYSVTVRNATEGEKMTTLTGEEHVLTAADTLIVDGSNNTPIGIAGIKGGKHAEVDMDTVDILLESAHFKAVPIRKSAQRLKLRTDASQRFENGVVKEFAGIGQREAVALIQEIAGGTLLGFVDVGSAPESATQVHVSLKKINAVLGLTLTQGDVEAILARFGYSYTVMDELFLVHPPFERRDLVIAEDIIEEIGRIHGYENVASVPIEKIPLREINKRFFYSEQIRDILFSLGYSEVSTSSFRDVDEVALTNALASDKGCLRSALYKNLNEALQKNAGNVELVGTDKVRIFEIGTVFTKDGEKLNLAIGVSSKAGATAKDFKEVKNIVTELEKALGILAIAHTNHEKEGVIEISLDDSIDALPAPTAYTKYEKSPEVTYKPFSNYPHVVRDIAFWTPSHTTKEEALHVVEVSAGALAIRTDCFDRFEKEGRVSYGFRIVFQSHEKTLTAEEVDAVMQTISSAISECGWEVR